MGCTSIGGKVSLVILGHFICFSAGIDFFGRHFNPQPPFHRQRDQQKTQRPQQQHHVQQGQRHQHQQGNFDPNFFWSSSKEDEDMAAVNATTSGPAANDTDDSWVEAGPRSGEGVRFRYRITTDGHTPFVHENSSEVVLDADGEPVEVVVWREPRVVDDYAVAASIPWQAAQESIIRIRARRPPPRLPLRPPPPRHPGASSRGSVEVQTGRGRGRGGFGGERRSVNNGRRRIRPPGGRGGLLTPSGFNRNNGNDDGYHDSQEYLTGSAEKRPRGRFGSREVLEDETGEGYDVLGYSDEKDDYGHGGLGGARARRRQRQRTGAGARGHLTGTSLGGFERVTHVVDDEYESDVASRRDSSGYGGGGGSGHSGSGSGYGSSGGGGGGHSGSGSSGMGGGGYGGSGHSSSGGGGYGGYDVPQKKPGPFGPGKPNFKCEMAKETLYVSKIGMTSDKKCFHVYKTDCKYEYADGKDIGFKKDCSEFSVTKCRKVFDTTFKTKCSTVYKKECEDFYVTKVDWDYKEKCSTSYEKACEGHGYHKKCHDVPKEHCKQVPVKIEKKVPKTKCKQVPKKKCKDVPVFVPRKECKNFPKTVCVKDPINVKKTLPKKVCFSVPQKKCNKIPVEFVKHVPKTVKKKVCVSTKSGYDHSGSWNIPSYEHFRSLPKQASGGSSGGYGASLQPSSKKQDIALNENRKAAVSSSNPYQQQQHQQQHQPQPPPAEQNKFAGGGGSSSETGFPAFPFPDFGSF